MTAQSTVTGRLLDRLAAGPVTETYAALADQFGSNVRTMKRAVASLRAAGLVTLAYHQHNGTDAMSSRVITLVVSA